MRHHDWYESVYPSLSGAGLWLRGGELNTVPPARLESARLRVLFARLSTYADTAASFTHSLLYQIAAGVEGVFPDLAYLPPRADLALFRRDRIPWLLGTQSKRGPEDFELLGLSLSIVQELLNVPALLRESGLPLSKRERLARADLPLVLLGGASALYSTVAWGGDPWVDAVFIGEDPAAIRQLLTICRDGRAAGLDKRSLLDALAAVPGLLEPDRPRTVRKASCPDLDAAEALERAPVPYLGDRAGSGHLQLSEGCPCFCAFCAESWDRKPFRERSVPRLRELALRAKAGMGLEELELFSASFNAHRGVYQLLWELVPLFARVRLKSQRFDLLAHDPAAAPAQHVLEKASLTCGLEGISPRLRRYLQKSLPDEDLHRALEAILRSHPRELKVFLIATGLEEDEDFAALEGLLARLGELRQRHHAGTRIIFSLTPLVRFPWTPLELEHAPTAAACAPLLSRAGRLVRAAGFEYREAAELDEYWVSQVLVRAAREELARALLRALEETGFLYYRYVERPFLERLRACLEEEGLAPDELLRGHSADEAARRPWALVETGVRREFLWECLERGRAFVDAEYCLGRSWLRARCAGCGACTPAQVAGLVGGAPERAPAPERLRDRVRAAREAEAPLVLLVDAGPAARGLPRRLLEVALVRALLAVHPQLTAGFRRYGGAALEGEGGPVWLEGLEAVTLLWQRDAVPVLEAAAVDPAARAAVSAALGDWGTWLGLAPSGWAPARITLRSPFRFAPEACLRGLGLKFTLRRSEQGYRLELPPAALKKGQLRSLAWHVAGGETEVALEPGPKLQLEELVRRGFELPRPEEWVRVRARVEA